MHQLLVRLEGRWKVTKTLAHLLQAVPQIPKEGRKHLWKVENVDIILYWLRHEFYIQLSQDILNFHFAVDILSLLLIWYNEMI